MKCYRKLVSGNQKLLYYAYFRNTVNEYKNRASLIGPVNEFIMPIKIQTFSKKVETLFRLASSIQWSPKHKMTHFVTFETRNLGWYKILLIFVLNSLLRQPLLISLLVSSFLFKNRMRTQKTEMAVTSLLELVIGSHFLSTSFSSFQSSQKKSCNLSEERIVIWERVCLFSFKWRELTQKLCVCF